MGSKGPGAVSYHLLRLSRKARDRARLSRYRSLPKPVVPPPVPRDRYLFWRPFNRRLVRSGYPALVMPGQFKQAFLDEWIGLIGQIPYSSCSFPAELVVHLMSSQLE